MRVDIEGLPVGMSESGELVCIPKTLDPPSIGIVGAKGKGKTILLGRIADYMYWFWKYLLLFANDYNGEMGSKTKPMQDNELFLKRLRWINDTPAPLPVITCVPDNSLIEHNSLKICRPYIKFLNNPTRFMPKEFKTSGKYLMKHKEDLNTLRTVDEAVDYLVENYPKLSQMTDALSATFKMLYDDEIFDISSTGVSKITNQETEFETLPGLMLAGIVPSLYTGLLKIKPYFHNYIYSILDELYTLQIDRTSKFAIQKLNVALFIDELERLCDTRSETMAERMVNQCMGAGRMARIAIVWATQIITKINATIAGNTNYCFAFAVNDNDQVKCIARNYDLPKYLAKDLPTLDTFECIAMTRDKFILYNSKGEKRYSSEPLRMMCLPPLSLHKAPNEN